VERFLVDSGNPSRGEGGDIMLGARTSKQIICICNCFLSYFTLLAIAYTHAFLSFALAIYF